MTELIPGVRTRFVPRQVPELLREIAATGAWLAFCADGKIRIETDDGEPHQLTRRVMNALKRHRDAIWDAYAKD